MKAIRVSFRYFFAALVLLLSVNMQGQSVKVSDIANKDQPVVWLGLDFTEARLIGDLGANELDIKNRIVHDINQLIVDEAKKYDVAGALKKSNVTSELKYVYERNKNLDETKLKSTSADDFKRFDKAMVEKIVSKYNFGDKKGLGVMFIVEAMNKSKEAASMWVTYIDMGSSKVLQTERREGKSGGFGFRNYWAKSAYEVLNDLKKGK